MERDIAVEFAAEKGRGIFAKRSFRKGQIIERAPVIAIIPSTKQFEDWELAWGHKKVALVGGFIHLYNHATWPNVELERDLLRNTVTVRALRYIKAGEELCYRYLCDIWFKMVA